jgi:hypothetical protein
MAAYKYLPPPKINLDFRYALQAPVRLSRYVTNEANTGEAVFIQG